MKCTYVHTYVRCTAQYRRIALVIHICTYEFKQVCILFAINNIIDRKFGRKSFYYKSTFSNYLCLYVHMYSYVCIYLRVCVYVSIRSIVVYTYICIICMYVNNNHILLLDYHANIYYNTYYVCMYIYTYIQHVYMLVCIYVCTRYRRRGHRAISCL